MNEIEKIKERLDIAEVVSSYLTLKRAGQNLKGPCPFHHEKTPSFMVNPERQIFRCFGCGEGGDVFTFIEKIEGVSFYNALKILADRAGVQLEPKSFQRNGQEFKSDQKTLLYDINDLAAKVYHKLLTDHPKAQRARGYLSERGLSSETIKEFQIGYAPDSWDFMIRFMTSKKFSKEEIFKAGLTVDNNRGDYYDRFRGRIMFPINNVMGNCIGFTSRVIVDDGKQAKYLNSADSGIYHKSNVLYGLDKAKLEIRAHNMAVVVEGNMDVIACHQAGFKNVVASSGTATTEEQIRALSRYAADIAFAFDSDTAGIAAMKRAVNIALKIDITPRIIEIPDGFKDPDEVIKHDKKIWKRAVDNARPALEVWIDRLAREGNINDISDRKKIAKEILPVVKSIQTEMEKEHYLKYLAKKLSTSTEILLRDLDKARSEERAASEQPQKEAALNIYQRIMAIFWSDRVVGMSLGSKLTAQKTGSDADDSLWQAMLDHQLEPEKLTPENKNLLDQWAHQFSLDYDDLDSDGLKSELLYLHSRLEQDKNEDLKASYSQLIKNAQEAGDKKETKRLLEEFSRLLKG